MFARALIVSCMIFSLTGGVPALAAEKPAGKKKVSFIDEVRPIFAASCFSCHGPDHRKRDSELRLDIADEASQEFLSPGNSAESLLIEHIETDDPDLLMPPADSGKERLSKEQIALLRRWVDEGAVIEGHWAYRPFGNAKPPKAGKRGRIVNDVDRFAVRGYEEHDVEQAPEADRRTLIRRVSFDLTGLPPAPQDVEAFLRAKDAKAYEQLVERLLASENFGERMAIYWLDVVRFGDTNGYHGDNHREHSPYRDYVIESFNKNKPFDVFSREQVAGDLFENATAEQRIASGYNRLNMTTREGGAQAKEYRAIYAADRVRNFSGTWLGLSMGCCQCHDHKYDPFTMNDFYSLAAFFADIEETAVGVQQPSTIFTAEQTAEMKRLDAGVAEQKRILATQTPTLTAAMNAWAKTPEARSGLWQSLVPTAATAPGEATLAIAEDGTVAAGGKNPDKTTYTLTTKAPLGKITGFRLDVLADDKLPAKGPGRAGNGNFVLNEVRFQLGDGKPLKVAVASASHSQGGYPIERTIDGNETGPNGWAILNQTGRNNHAVFELKDDLTLEADSVVTITMVQVHGGAHTLGRFRWSAIAQSRPLRSGPQFGEPGVTERVLATADEKRTDAERNALAAYFRSQTPLLDPVRQKQKTLEQQKAAVQAQGKVLLVSKSVKPRMTRLLPRGDWQDDSGEIVQPVMPEHIALSYKPGETPFNRVDLANWLTDRRNPLTARVWVNRLWKLMFGQGISSSLDDIGSQGTWPTHPELIDWLAEDFMEHGWDTKRTLKLIVMSATYRQSSQASKQLRERDPANKWLARQGSFRLDAEMVRDNALAVSGLLVNKIGGKSAKPYQPAGYWAHLNFPQRTYKHDTGENQYRRGLYTYWARTFLHPSLAAFDASSREECMAQRPRSNTPLQALVLLNDPTYVEAARVFAARVIREGGSDTHKRLSFAFTEALGREIRESEAAILTKLYNDHHQQYAASPDEAGALLKTGLAKVPEGSDPVELAAWTSVSRVILNLHESITRY